MLVEIVSELKKTPNIYVKQGKQQWSWCCWNEHESLKTTCKHGELYINNKQNQQEIEQVQIRKQGGFLL